MCMAKWCELVGLRRAGAALLVVAVAVLPLLHAMPSHALGGCGGGDAVAEGCCGDPCGVCASGCAGAECSHGEAMESSPAGDETPSEPAPEDDRPCDCPFCGKVVPVVSMISPVLAGTPFWGEVPTLLPIARDACPDSVAMRVDIQPPIV